jgi:hypothetical protein
VLVAPGSDGAMSAQPPYPFAAPPPGYVPASSAPRPLARRAVLPLTLLHVALSGLIVFAPIVLLGAGDRSPAPMHLWQHFREGGWGMWLITLLLMFLALLSAVLGALMIRGKRVPGAVIFTLAFSPFAAAMIGTLTSLRHILDAISGASIDPSQRARILAEGLSETSNLYVYGGVGASFAMYLAGLAAAFTLITIDPDPLGPISTSKAWIAGPIAGVASAILAVAARILHHQSLGGLDLLVVFGLLTVGLIAALAAQPLPALIAARNDDEAGPAWRLLLVAAFAFAAAMLLLDRASMAALDRRMLDAISGESIDPSQRATILAVTGEEMHGRLVVMIVDALGCLAAFSAPLIAGLAAKKKFSIAGAIAGAAALLMFAAALGTGSRIDSGASREREAMVAMEKSLISRGITLPVGRIVGRSASFSGAAGLSMQRDGAVVDARDAEDTYGRETVPLAVDAALPFELFASKLAPALGKAGTSRTLGLVVAPQQRYDYSRLGAYGGLLGSDLQMIEVQFDDQITDGLPTGARSSRGSYGGYAPDPVEGRDRALGVLVDADKARLFVFSTKAPTAGLLLSEALPIEDTAAGDTARASVLSTVAKAHPGLGTVVIAPGSGETMGQLTGLLTSIVDGLDDSRLDLVITPDRAGLEALPAGGARAAEARATGGVRLRDVTVNGRLPVEVVTRILRQNLGRYARCRDDAKVHDKAAPPEEVALRFVIDRRGVPSPPTVTPATSAVLGGCIQLTTRVISFPEPEGGIVSVTAKLLFP